MVASRSAFCRVEAKAHGVALMPMKLKPHIWAWVREVRSEHGVSMGNFEPI
jgi:hypothetical protein